jgi:hypothetical protein
MRRASLATDTRRMMHDDLRVAEWGVALGEESAIVSILSPRRPRAYLPQSLPEARPRVRVGRLVGLALAMLYTMSYGLWRILLLTPLYQEFWQLQLSDVFGSWAYLPLVPLGLLVALTRNRRAAYLLLLPLFFFGAEYGRQFLPNWQRLWPREEPVAVLRVMSWNMLYTSDRA